jgi:hypothetical protein
MLPSVFPLSLSSPAMSLSPDNDAPNHVSPAPITLPKAGVILKAREPVEIDGTEGERNTIFDNLVKVEGEVAGLVAYSIYKQNKRAWLQDFIKATGRPPSDAESRAYIIGESTERRLATYRHLAAATLAGQGPETPTAAGRTVRPSESRPPWLFAIWAVVLVAAVALLAYALHVGLDVGK